MESRKQTYKHQAVNEATHTNKQEVRTTEKRQLQNTNLSQFRHQEYKMNAIAINIQFNNVEKLTMRIEMNDRSRVTKSTF